MTKSLRPTTSLLCLQESWRLQNGAFCSCGVCLFVCLSGQGAVLLTAPHAAFQRTVAPLRRGYASVLYKKNHKIFLVDFLASPALLFFLLLASERLLRSVCRLATHRLTRAKKKKKGFSSSSPDESQTDRHHLPLCICVRCLRLGRFH